MRIVYMGTPEFAVLPLERLISDKHEILLVVTQPDKAKDRGKQIHFSPVKQKALDFGIEVIQPEKIKGNIEFLDKLRKLAPDVIVVAAYGKKLPIEVLELPKYGCINIHGSLLPRYRGAAPIQRSIINGDEVTGISIMLMSEGMDTGDVMMKESMDAKGKTFIVLHDALSELGAKLISEALESIENGTAVWTPQNEEEATFAKMICKADGLIDFTEDPIKIEKLTRGLSPWPGVYTIYKGQQLKFTRVKALDILNTEPPGTLTGASKAGIEIAAGGKTLLVEQLQFPGKKPMTVEDYLRGNKFDESVVFGQ
jgi:methionyl-tRNA formyltransferase